MMVHHGADAIDRLNGEEDERIQDLPRFEKVVVFGNRCGDHQYEFTAANGFFALIDDFGADRTVFLV